MANRNILDTDPDPGRLFDELFAEGVRDFRGLNLGDVAGHARRRYSASYGVMQLVVALEQLGRLPPDAVVAARGASDQDKQVSGSEQAAHILPREIVVRSSAGVQPLYDFLRVPFNQTWVRYHLFAPTDRVHRLVNVADSSCERGLDGMAAALVELCNRTLEDVRRDRRIATGPAPASSSYAQDRFHTQLVPCYRMVANLRRTRLEKEMTQFERSELTRATIVLPDGRPATPRATDTRLGSPDAQARAEAKRTLSEIFAIYERTDPDRHALADIAGKIDALRYNDKF